MLLLNLLLNLNFLLPLVLGNRVTGMISVADEEVRESPTSSRHSSSCSFVIVVEERLQYFV